MLYSEPHCLLEISLDIGSERLDAHAVVDPSVKDIQSPDIHLNFRHLLKYTMYIES